MIFTETRLKEAYLIDIDPRSDERGFFARVYCEDQFQAHGLNNVFVQCNISYNKTKGTLRGMHYQVAPYEEIKLVRCTAGAIYDVIIDLRPTSDTYKQWFAVELTAQNRRTLYIPSQFAHGFVTLEDDTEILYYMSEFYHPECARGIRWDDTAFHIEWPRANYILSDRDKTFSDFTA